MFDYQLTETFLLRVVQGDITEMDVDAIVNAANPKMLGGGGLDGAIHEAAGPMLIEACRLHDAVRGVRCPKGEARITPGFRLSSRYIIHTVGPKYDEEKDPVGMLVDAHAAVMALANKHNVESLALPAISCGSYGYPAREAAPIAIATCIEYLGKVRTLTFVLRDKRTLNTWKRAADKLESML